MSVHVISAVLACRDKELSPARRMILVVLANFAGDDWRSWPSQVRIAEQAGCKERQAREHLKWLEAEGFISRHTVRLGQGNGSRTSYEIHAGRLRTETDVDERHETIRPAEIAGTIRPAENRHCTGRKPPITNRQEPSVDKANALSIAREKKSGAVRGSLRGSRLPDNWQLGPSEIQYAANEGMSPMEVQRECERFRDYWRSQSGQRAVKRDWSATWRNWCRSWADRRPANRSSQPSAGSYMDEAAIDAAAHKRRLYSLEGRGGSQPFPQDVRISEERQPTGRAIAFERS